ncbi:thymidylate kinase isoform X2 [Haplochromis burtoni]|uniref:thymidylate kinase isoform X2 n=1 Tax=Haplochromis burtoni TaxID=8153 RepID=UPI001C2D3C58|nr:thymidylate kinase isoform X2 [Haplochromis burtoni]
MGWLKRDEVKQEVRHCVSLLTFCFRKRRQMVIGHRSVSRAWLQFVRGFCNVHRSTDGQWSEMAGKRGALIVLEGVDRAGKTTQCSKLVQALQQSGRPAEMMRFPDRTTTIGQLIGAYLENKSDLEDHTVHLLFSANRWEMVRNPMEVFCLLQGFRLDWCMQPDVGLPKPDLVMFLQLNPAEAALRGQFGQERYETSVFQRTVQQRFEQLMKDQTVNWQVIDAAQNIENVHKDITAHSLNAINKAQNLPLGELWSETLKN